MPMNQSGSSLLMSLVLIFFISLVFFVLLNQGVFFRGVEEKVGQDALAQIYASELLEFFRSFESSTKLKQYLKDNPTGTGNAYFFCRPVNVLDRATGNTLNPDPLANLPPSRLLSAFRFYQVQVFNASNKAPDNSWCNRSFDDPSFDLSGNETERVMVTVGVSFAPDPHDPSKVKQVVLSALLPMP